MKRALNFAGALVIGWASILGTAAAQEAALKPVVTVAFSGYEELRGDIDMIGQLANNPQLAPMVEAISGGQQLAGLDKARPWGFVVQTDGANFPMYGFIPVSDTKQLVESLRGRIGEATEKDGTYEVTLRGQPLYIKPGGQWALVGTNPEIMPAQLDNAEQLLGGLNKTYDLAIQVNAANVPDAFRQMIVATVQMGAQRALAKREGESDEAYAARKQLMESSNRRQEAMLNDMELFTVGLVIDQKQKNAAIDLSMVFKEGSPSASRSMAGVLPTTLAGFLDSKAAITFNLSAKIGDQDKQNMLEGLQAVNQQGLAGIKGEGLSGADNQRAQAAFKELMEVVRATIEAGEMDVAGSVHVTGTQLMAAVGAKVVDAAKMDKHVRQLMADLAKEQPDKAELIKVEAANENGNVYHTLSIPLEDLDLEEAPRAQLQRLMGDNVDIALGFGSGKVYAAIGRDALAGLRQAVGQSQQPKDVEPAALVVSLGPIVQAIAENAEQDRVKQMASMIAGPLNQSQGKDRVSIVAGVVPNGQTVRITLDEGVLRLVGSAPMLVMGMMGGPGG